MAIVKVTLDNGSEIEIEMPAEIADTTIAIFARYVTEGTRPENRQIVDSAQSFYIDHSKVAMIRREY